MGTRCEAYAHSEKTVWDLMTLIGSVLHSVQILCLQEVQENHFYEHLLPVLSLWGRSSMTVEQS